MRARQNPSVLKKALIRNSFNRTIKDFPHMVDLGNRTYVVNRVEIREWLMKQSIRTYKTFGEPADVIWDKAWRKFYFKKYEHYVMFKLIFGSN